MKVGKVLGLDPGKNGGIAWVDDFSGASAEKMPDTEREVFRLLAAHAQGSVAVLEKVHSMPKQGVAGVFTFGQGYGFLRGVLTALDIPFVDVTPQRWQKDMACLTKGDKNESKRLAQQLFPTIRMTHALADALLIATWGARQDWRGIRGAA